MKKSTSKDEARHDFLKRASSLLQVSSPSVSSYLQLASKSPAKDDYTQKAGEDVQSCPSCGTISIPGWSCELITKTGAKRTRKDRIEKVRGETHILHIKCSRCGAVAPYNQAKSPNLARRPHQGPPRNEAPAMPSIQTATTQPGLKETGAHAGQPSRKRVRGKKSTLQSLLSEQKAPPSAAQSGFGLDLMDFMKG